MRAHLKCSQFIQLSHNLDSLGRKRISTKVSLLLDQFNGWHASPNLLGFVRVPQS